MNFELKITDWNTLKADSETQQIVAEKASISHAILRVNNKKFGLSWSNLSSPTVLQLDGFHLLVIGVNQTVIAINTSDASPKFLIGLSDPFNFFLEVDHGFIIFSETTILVINGETCSISRFTGTPDIIQNAHLNGSKLEVFCLSSTYVIEV
jgi:hypothetical protein